MDRRTFLSTTAAASGLALLGTFHTTRAAVAADSPYGALGAVDSLGLQLPPGFTARVIAETDVPVAGFTWHRKPDGGATFAQPDGGWVYVSNQESGGVSGGASMIRFDASGEIIDAGRILSGTTRNCAGGPTPWGTWLSCEEYDFGQVWECDPLGLATAVVHPAMGTFQHEAAAADSVNQVISCT